MSQERTEEAQGELSTLPRARLALYVSSDLARWIRGEARRDGLTCSAWLRRLLLHHKQNIEAKRNGL